MRLKPMSGNYIPKNEFFPLSSSIASIGSKNAFILDDEGFQKEFGDDWLRIKKIVVRWCESILKRNNHLHSIDDLTKNYNEIDLLAWADTSNTGENLSPIIKKIFKEKQFKDHKTKLIKVLYGGTIKKKK